MSKTHYDYWLENSTDDVRRIIDRSIEKVKAGQVPQPFDRLVFGDDIHYIVFKCLNAKLVYEVPSDVVWQELYGIFNFVRFGKKVYELAPNLCDRFSATHIKSVPVDLLRLPFNSILLNIPKGKLVIDGENGEKLSPIDIYIYYGNEVEFDDTVDRDKFLELLRSGNIKKGLKMLRLVVFSEVTPVPSNENSIKIMNWNIPLAKPTVSECVDNSIEIIKDYWIKHKHTEGMNDVGLAELKDTAIKPMKEMFEFVMKSLLYITGANADIVYEDKNKILCDKFGRAKSSGKRKEIQRRIDNAGSPRYMVGTKIILSRNERLMYEGIRTGEWHLSYRFIVQGHFREQAYGERHSLRKNIFIEPFWKGPEFGEIVNKEHLVK